MNKETFRMLKEITSLDTKLAELEFIIQDELKRITKIQKMRDERQNDLCDYQDLLKDNSKRSLEIDHELSALQEVLKSTQVHLACAINSSEISIHEVKISNTIQRIEELESEAFEKLEQSEQVQSEIEDCKTFMLGSLKSIKLIEDEIEVSNAEVYKEIKSINSRLKLVFEQIPPKALNLFNSIRDKKLKFGPLTRIDNKSCFICRFSVTPIDIQGVERDFKFKSCKGCSRIFIPESSLY